MEKVHKLSSLPCMHSNSQVWLRHNLDEIINCTVLNSIKVINLAASYWFGLNKHAIKKPYNFIIFLLQLLL